MKVNGQEIKAKRFAFDGCHKIYICESCADEADATETGYELYSIRELEDKYEGSCSLRFISNWQLNKQFVPQFEDAVFEA